MSNIEILEIKDKKYIVHCRIQNANDNTLSRMKEIYKNDTDYYFIRSKKQNEFLICKLIEDADFSDID